MLNFNANKKNPNVRKFWKKLRGFKNKKNHLK